MSRRVTLPGADELFRSTHAPAPTTPTNEPAAAADAPDESTRPAPPVDGPAATSRRDKGGSGRVRHDEKITVYVTSDELHDLESTRLSLRREHGLAVDRGRIVREAITLALEAVEAEGENSALVRRLRTQ